MGTLGCEMYIKKAKGSLSVRLPDGTLMSLSDLPSVDTKRWVASRKAAVVRAVAHGLIKIEDALEAYGLSEDEFMAWVRAVAEYGEDALKTTAIQKEIQLKLGKREQSATITGDTPMSLYPERNVTVRRPEYAHFFGGG